MKPEKHVAKMREQLEMMHLEGHIDDQAKYVAAEDISIALEKLARAIEQNMRHK